MLKGDKYHIKHFPKCSSKCLSTCPSCKIDQPGHYTGRNFLDKNKEILYEFLYEKNNKKNYGLFLKDELII